VIAVVILACLLVFGGVFAASRVLARDFAELTAGAEKYSKNYIVGALSSYIDTAFTSIANIYGGDGAISSGMFNISADISENYLDTRFSNVYGYANSSEIVHMLGQSAFNLSFSSDLSSEFLKTNADLSWSIAGDDKLNMSFSLDDALYVNIPELYPSTLAMSYENLGLSEPFRASDITELFSGADTVSSQLVVQSMYAHREELRPMLSQMLEASAEFLDFSLEKGDYLYANANSAPIHAASVALNSNNISAALTAALQVIRDNGGYLSAVSDFLNETHYYRLLSDSPLTPDYLAELIDRTLNDLELNDATAYHSAVLKIYIDRNNLPAGFALFADDLEVSLNVIHNIGYEFKVSDSRESFRLFGELNSTASSSSGTINCESAYGTAELGEFSSLNIGMQGGAWVVSFDLDFDGAAMASVLPELDPTVRAFLNETTGTVSADSSPKGMNMTLNLVMAPDAVINISAESSIGKGTLDTPALDDVIYLDSKNPTANLNVMLLISGVTSLIEDIESSGYDLSGFIANYFMSSQPMLPEQSLR
jgi:hypothetical protein